jgi:hypothetical protein
MFKGETLRSLTPEQIDGWFRQPKKGIGDLVAAMGILVPARYSWEEARQRITAGETIIARSEHPDELAGPSGIFASSVITDEVYFIWDRIKSENESGVFEYLKYLECGYEGYCQLAGIDPQKYLTDLTYSFWQYVPGLNVLIGADTCNPKKHYCVVNAYHNKYNGYFVLNEGQIKPVGRKQDILFPDKLLETAALYDSITAALDPNHCAIMEFKVNEEGEVFFLQYHRTQDINHSRFQLSKDQKRGIKAQYVRGATSQQGFEIVAPVGDNFMSKGGYVLDVADAAKISALFKEQSVNGNGLASYFIPPELLEYLSRIGQAHIIARPLSWLKGHIDTSHMTLSYLLKSPSTLIIPEIVFKTALQGKTQRFPVGKYKAVDLARMRVVSDGNDGYVEVLPF